ncbi:MAG TPA: hypothetical protein VEZ71_14080, partial [Archangium sp.]|nr:hypothetical protein [Archangium sp.]
PDLTVGEWGVRCTLSFSGSRFKVAVPWSALFAITSHLTKEFWMYPDDMPAELIQQTMVTSKVPESVTEQPAPAVERPRAVLREVGRPEDESPSPEPEPVAAAPAPAPTPVPMPAPTPVPAPAPVSAPSPVEAEGPKDEPPSTRRGHLRLVK